MNGMQHGSRHPRRFVAGGGDTVTTSTTNAASGTLTNGTLYRLTSTTPVVCRWGATAAADTDGSFDFGLGANESIVVEGQGTALQVIEPTGGTGGRLWIAELEADY